MTTAPPTSPRGSCSRTSASPAPGDTTSCRSPAVSGPAGRFSYGKWCFHRTGERVAMSRFAELAAVAAEKVGMLGGVLESIYLSRLDIPPIEAHDAARGIQRIELEHVSLRLRITGDGPRTIVIVPDPPNTIEHYDELIDLLRGDARVICFEVPGFGLSFPRSLTFGFSPTEYTDVVVELIDRL